MRDFPWGILLGLGGALLLASSIGEDEPVSGGKPPKGKAPPLGARVPDAGWSGLLPRGKGIFVYDLGDADGPQNMADRLEWLGMDWVLIQTHRQRDDGTMVIVDKLASLEAHVEAIRARGIDVGFWGWPVPAGASAWAQKAADYVKRFGPSGYVVNCEKPWKVQSSADVALAMMETVREALGPNRGLCMTSYGGGPPNHPTFPWAQLALFCDFGMPQIYDMRNNLPSGYPKNSVKWWSEQYPAIVPAWSAGESKTPETMADIQNRTPLPDAAACWWSFRSAISNSGRAAAVRSYSLVREDAIA